jgi:hypothetical protein
MGDVVIDMSMWLDGYIAALFGNLLEETGAVIMDRRS